MLQGTNHIWLDTSEHTRVKNRIVAQYVTIQHLERITFQNTLPENTLMELQAEHKRVKVKLY